MTSPNFDESFLFPMSPLISYPLSPLVSDLDDSNATFIYGGLDELCPQNNGTPPNCGPNGGEISFVFLSNNAQVNQTQDQTSMIQNPIEISNNGTQEMVDSFFQLETNDERETNKKKPKYVKRKTSMKQKQDEEEERGKSKRGSQQRKRQTGVTSSIYRGVSRYTDRFETFLWDSSDPRQKPKTVYIGGYDDEESAARAYDLAALKVWGESATLNFPMSNYEKESEEMKYYSKNEYFLYLRRNSKGFAKGASIYRGVSRRNSDFKKWQARIGKGKELKGIYLGTFATELEAARAYDVAALRLRGAYAATNFDMNEYDMLSLFGSTKLPIGKGASRLLTESSIHDIIRKKRHKNEKDKLVCFDDSEIEFPLVSRQEFQTNSGMVQGFNSFGTGLSSNMNIDGNLEFGSNGNQAMGPVGFSMNLSAKDKQPSFSASKDFQTTCGSFQALLSLQGQDFLNLIQAEDAVSNQNLNQNRNDVQTKSVPVEPSSGGYNGDVSRNGVSQGGLNSTETVDNANGGCHGSAKASDNGAAMVENTIPENAENIENGVNLFEDGDMDFLSRWFELINEFGSLCS